jgi:hypothetical protein
MKKIMWQKYEDLLEEQISSPLIKSIVTGSLPDTEDIIDIGNLSESEMEELQNEIDMNKDLSEKELRLSVSESLMNEISLTSTFDCWVGHTNFNITKDVAKKINKSEGVEALKICSRYRFFIGVGRMFEFKNVRKNIEQILTGE